MKAKLGISKEFLLGLKEVDTLHSHSESLEPFLKKYKQTKHLQ